MLAGNPTDPVLVTGASGFLGKALVARLRVAGRAVQSAPRSSALDISRENLDLSGVNHVFHLAARTFVPAAWDDPVSFHLTNVHGTVRILEQCRKQNKSMTYVSGYVYGPALKMPIAEDVPACPNNPYAFSKFMGEQACRFYSQTFGVRTIIVRPFNIYGAGQSDEFLVPMIVTQALDPTRSEIVVKDLLPKRDYVHVDDVIDALLLTETAPSEATFNVGSGVSFSVADIVALTLDAAGENKLVRATGEARANELADVVADISKLKSLGWYPKISLAQGIKQLIQDKRRCRTDLGNADG